jgi:hypothetical protein
VKFWGECLRILFIFILFFCVACSNRQELWGSWEHAPTPDCLVDGKVTNLKFYPSGNLQLIGNEKGPFNFPGTWEGSFFNNEVLTKFSTNEYDFKNYGHVEVLYAIESLKANVIRLKKLKIRQYDAQNKSFTKNETQSMDFYCEYLKKETYEKE